MLNPYRNIPGTGNPNLTANPQNPNWKIFFRHVATGAQVAFEGWVTDFSDNFQSEWTNTPAYGRMDPLATFQRTGRTITLSFDVPAADRQQAIANTGNVDLLIKFLYPVYADGQRTYGNVLKASPLLTLRWANLIANYGAAGDEELVGYLSGINYAPDLDAGFFMVRGQKLFPQLLKINFTFTVLHTVLPGWSITNRQLHETESTEVLTQQTKGLSGAVLGAESALGDEETQLYNPVRETRTTKNWVQTETGEWMFGKDSQHFPHAGNLPNNPILDTQMLNQERGIGDTTSLLEIETEEGFQALGENDNMFTPDPIGPDANFLGRSNAELRKAAEDEMLGSSRSETSEPTIHTFRESG
jgi:hypothetical protein